MVIKLASSADVFSSAMLASTRLVLTVARREALKSKSVTLGRLLLRLSTRSEGINEEPSIVRLPIPAVAEAMRSVRLKTSKS